MQEWKIRNDTEPQDGQESEKTFSKDGKDGKDDTNGLVGHRYCLGRNLSDNLMVGQDYIKIVG